MNASNAPSALNMSRTIAITLGEEMERDESVIVIGEDVGKMGGVFGSSRQLQRSFGPARVIDAPISEQSFVGLAVGAAQAGLRPIVELMFVDFIGTCLDQVYNQMAKNHYMSGGGVTVPVVVKTAVGSIGDAAQHSQVLSALFAHLPGLTLAFPSCPGDARRLLQTAVRSDDPVVFFEHKKLLLAKSEELLHYGEPDGEPLPFGRANTVRAGDDVTIVATGWMVQESLRAASELSEDGISCEVIDLRTVVPWDREAVLRSALRTGRLLVVDEDYRSFGIGAEIIASLVEAHPREGVHCARVGVPDVPIPASPILEAEIIPGVATVVAACKDLIGRSRS